MSITGDGGAVDRTQEVRPLEGDRGVRKIENMPLEAYFAFGDTVRYYQHTHPDTLVRVSAQANMDTRTGSITVRWWQRGTEEPR